MKRYKILKKKLLYRFIVGPYEEKDYTIRSSQSGGILMQRLNNPAEGSRRWHPLKQKNVVLVIISQMLRIYKKIIYRIKCCDKHKTCPHPFSCLFYTMEVSIYIFIDLKNTITIFYSNIFFKKAKMINISHVVLQSSIRKFFLSYL